MGVTTRSLDIPPDLGYTGFMTHDELSKKIEALWHDSFKDPVYATLRAVVELHQPQEITLPDGSWGKGCKECDSWSYPCLTIEIVVGKLNGQV